MSGMCGLIAVAIGTSLAGCTHFRVPDAITFTAGGYNLRREENASVSVSTTYFFGTTRIVVPTAPLRGTP